MRKLFGFLMVGLTFTVFQFATDADAVRGAPPPPPPGFEDPAGLPHPNHPDAMNEDPRGGEPLPEPQVEDEQGSSADCQSALDALYDAGGQGTCSSVPLKCDDGGMQRHLVDGNCV